MSIAEFIMDDPVFAAQAMGLEWDEFLPDMGFRYGEFDCGPGAKAQDFEACESLKADVAHPCLILDNSDTREFSTPSLLGERGFRSAGEVGVREFWKTRGAMCVSIKESSAGGESSLLAKLIRSRVFTSVVIGGTFCVNCDEDRENKKQFEAEVAPLLKRFVEAGGVLIVQGSQGWKTYERVFKEEIGWKPGGGARGFGVHGANRERVQRLFPRSAAPWRGRQTEEGKMQSFYVKGALLKNVPDTEACFSSVEVGYPAAENVVVACKAVGKGHLCWVGAHNMCDCSSLIRDFLEQNALSRDQFEGNCADSGIWSGSRAVTKEDFGGRRSHDGGAPDDGYGAWDAERDAGVEGEAAPAKRRRRGGRNRRSS